MKPGSPRPIGTNDELPPRLCGGEEAAESGRRRADSAVLKGGEGSRPGADEEPKDSRQAPRPTRSGASRSGIRQMPERQWSGDGSDQPATALSGEYREAIAADGSGFHPANRATAAAQAPTTAADSTGCVPSPGRDQDCMATSNEPGTSFGVYRPDGTSPCTHGGPVSLNLQSRFARMRQTHFGPDR